MQLISLVIPVFNEEKAIHQNLGVILSQLPKGRDLNFEVVVIDDGSSDATANQAAELAKEHSKVTLYSFTRNFGKEAAIMAGLKKASGDAVIIMDSDLQHPPQLIGQMLTYWTQGFRVVEAVKEHRGEENFFSKISANIFYFLFKKLSGYDLTGQSDFKLLDREVVELYNNLPENQKFFRGLVHWFGYPSVQIPFSVPERKGPGGSRWSKLKLIKYAINNITMFSSIPLRLVSVLGLGTLLFGFIFGVISLWQKIQGQALTGFTTVNLLIIVIGGAILFSLGIVGHYSALIYDELKARPQFILKKKK